MASFFPYYIISEWKAVPAYPMKRPLPRGGKVGDAEKVVVCKGMKTPIPTPNGTTVSIPRLYPSPEFLLLL